MPEGLELSLSVRDQLSSALAGVSIKMSELERKMATVNAAAGRTSAATAQTSSAFGAMAQNAGRLGGSIAHVERGLLSLAGVSSGPVANIAGTIGAVSGAVRGLGTAVTGALGPWGLLAAGIVAAGVAAYSFMSQSDPLPEKLKKQAEAAKAAAEEFKKMREEFIGWNVAGALGAGEGKNGKEIAQLQFLARQKEDEIKGQAGVLEDTKIKRMRGKATSQDVDREQARLELLESQRKEATDEIAFLKRNEQVLKDLAEQQRKTDEAWNKLQGEAVTESDQERIRRSAAVTGDMSESLQGAAGELDKGWQDRNAKDAAARRSMDYAGIDWEQENYARGVEAQEKARKEAEDKQRESAEKVAAHWEAAAQHIDMSFQDAFQSVILDGENFGSAFGRLGKNMSSVFLSEVMGSFTKGIAQTVTQSIQMVVGASSGGAATSGAGGMGGGAAQTATSSLFGSFGSTGSAASTAGGGGGSGTLASIGAVGGGIMAGAGAYQSAKSGNIGNAVMSGAAAGAMIGSIAGPIGTVIGGVVGAIGGAIAGLFGSSRKRKKKRAAKRRAEAAERARRLQIAGIAQRTLQKGAAGGMMLTSEMSKIGDLMAGGLTYDEAIGYFGSEGAITNAAAKVKATTTSNTTNNVSVQAPVTVNATVNSEADVDNITRSIGQKLGQTIASAIPRP